jgi:sugar phosphate isomerase/epimerase
MKLAFSKPTRNDEQQRELIGSFRDCGYDGLQLKLGQYSAYLDSPRSIFADYPQLEGAISGLICGASVDDDASVGQLRKVTAFAEAVAADLVVVVPGGGRANLGGCHGQPPRDDIARIAAGFAELAARAADAGARLTLHNHVNSPLMLPDDFEAFFEQAESAPYGFTVDTAHLVKSGVTDVQGVIRRFAPSIDNFHLKDIAGSEFVVLGDGEIDFGPVLAAIREIGYDGWVSADEESGSELRSAMEQCYRVLAEGLGIRGV